MTRTPRVIILNNEIMPYRIPLFEQLAARGNIDPLVLYCAYRSSERDWDLDLFEKRFPHKILPGRMLQLKKPSYGEHRTIWINPTLLSELIQFKPDVIIGYEYSVPALTALFYSQLAGCRYITWTEMTGHAERNLVFGQRVTRRIILPRSDGLIGTSRAACENLVAAGVPRDRVVTAPQPLDTTWHLAQNELLRASLTEHPPTFLYVGSLIPRKGVNYLLEAFKLVLAEYPGALLKIGGAGFLKESLITMAEEAGISDRVQFLGFIQPNRLPEVYASSDIFILPTLEDTFAVVATEALAYGLSLICSQYAGFSSHISDGKNGFIVDPLDHAQLAERMLRLLKEDDLRECFLINSRSLLAEVDPAHVAEKFEEAVSIALAHG